MTDRSRSYAFIFVCQAGPLELPALVLAASLKRNLRCDNEIIAAVPTPPERWGAVPLETLNALTEQGVRIVPIRNDIALDYPIGNKISCLRVSTSADRLVFVDTDVLLVRDFRDEPRFAVPFAAKPADLANIVNPRHWKRAYSAVGLQLPPGRVATTLYGRLVPPYFNAGLIAVDARIGFGDEWLECCKRIDAKWGIPLKRPHLDQIALPVAVHKLGLKYESLDERYNFPAHLKPLLPANPPLFAHYHAPHVLRREPFLIATVRSLCDDFPSLADSISRDEQYAPLLRRRAMASMASSGPEDVTVHRSAPAADATVPQLIITGIPRSGTSYLCNLLHRFENCVILNEPEGISRPLRKEPIPFGVGTFYRDIRRDVLEGRPIRNKLRDGRVTDETIDANGQVEYTPSVTGPDFVLGVKSPLGFLGRLNALRRAMPDARIIACIRNPYDTIASWKTTFSHLKTADVAALTHGGLRDPFLSAGQRAALKEVAGLKTPAWRRAAWWRYLADLILDAGATAIVVPYPVLTAAPMPVVNRILDGFNTGALREPIAPSVARAAKRSALDEEDLQAIRALCGEAAVALGVGEGWNEEDPAPPAPPAPQASGIPPAASAAANTAPGV